MHRRTNEPWVITDQQLGQCNLLYGSKSPAKKWVWIGMLESVAVHALLVFSCYCKLQLDVCHLSRGGVIWWTFTKERQTWCNLLLKLVKLCDPYLSTLWVGYLLKLRYINTLPFLSFLLCSRTVCLRHGYVNGLSPATLYELNPFKLNGVRWLHFRVFRATVV